MNLVASFEWNTFCKWPSLCLNELNFGWINVYNLVIVIIIKPLIVNTYRGSGSLLSSHHAKYSRHCELKVEVKYSQMKNVQQNSAGHLHVYLKPDCLNNNLFLYPKLVSRLAHLILKNKHGIFYLFCLFYFLLSCTSSLISLRLYTFNSG